MNNIKKSFSIKDLENLSGIKAHTIRIWEKRYNLLQPERTETNIRTYSTESLQKLLNINILYNNGYKISKIANIPEEEIAIHVKEIANKNAEKNHAINAFKMAMVNFDQSLFYNTYNNLLIDHSFREVFKGYFLPLLEELGLLWQTQTINPSHEHFISNLIKQKILVNIEKLQSMQMFHQDKVFVLFLPENEIHDIGLLYVQYETLLHGYPTIYLGPSVPVENLKDVLNYYDNLIYLSYFTVQPTKDKIDSYIKKFIETVDANSKTELWILGKQAQHISLKNKPNNISIFQSIDQVVEKL